MKTILSSVQKRLETSAASLEAEIKDLRNLLEKHFAGTIEENSRSLFVTPTKPETRRAIVNQLKSLGVTFNIFSTNKFPFVYKNLQGLFGFWKNNKTGAQIFGFYMMTTYDAEEAKRIKEANQKARDEEKQQAISTFKKLKSRIKTWGTFADHHDFLYVNTGLDDTPKNRKLVREELTATGFTPSKVQNYFDYGHLWVSMDRGTNYIVQGKICLAFNVPAKEVI